MLRSSRFYLFIILLLSQSLSAAETLYQQDGIAINGYDPVSYQAKQRASKGDASHSYRWNNALWLFASAENRSLFAADPEKYAPQYGGFCAYAASKNALAPTGPEAWTVKEGKLYLNYSKSIRTTWQKDIVGNIELADGYWPGLMNQ